MALAGSYLDREELAARLGPAQAALVRGDWIDPTGTFADATKIARRNEWRAFLDGELVTASAAINDRLRKRYAAPFDAPTPAIILRWLVALVMPKIYEGRGWDASDAQAGSLLKREDRALDEMKEAADAENGLFDLPLRQDQQQSAVTEGGPYVYSEPDSYTWMDVQRAAVRR
ncbi:MAG: DUF1320 family protein [Labilithrix sp.]|nr:DUF1320 family protein [Labilithrix sp.]